MSNSSEPIVFREGGNIVPPEDSPDFGKVTQIVMPETAADPDSPKAPPRPDKIEDGTATPPSFVASDLNKLKLNQPS